MTDTSFEDRMRKAFSIAAIMKVYVDKGTLTEDSFGRAFRSTVEIRSLHIDGLEWLLFDQLLSVCRHIPLTDHIEALCAGLGRPFHGIEDFYRTAVELDLLPSFVLNRTVFFCVPHTRRLFGEMLVELGLTSEVVLQRCLGIKELIRSQTGDNAAVGQIFRSVGRVSIVDFFQVLAFQVDLPFESLDQSAVEIYDAAIRMNAKTLA